MIEEKTRVPNPARYELVRADGMICPVTFRTATEAADMAKELWPDQEQDEDRSGKGWDIQTVGCK